MSPCLVLTLTTRTMLSSPGEMPHSFPRAMTIAHLEFALGTFHFSFCCMQILPAPAASNVLRIRLDTLPSLQAVGGVILEIRLWNCRQQSSQEVSRCQDRETRSVWGLRHKRLTVKNSLNFSGQCVKLFIGENDIPRDSSHVVLHTLYCTLR